MKKDESAATILMVLLICAAAVVGLLNYCFGIKTEWWMMFGLAVLFVVCIRQARKAFY